MPVKRRKLRQAVSIPAADDHEYDFVSPPPDYFQTECAVCLLVLCAPHITSCCGQNFCKECIDSVQKDGKSCPLCNRKDFTLTYNRAHDVALKQLKVHCTHRASGCTWKGKIDALQKHREESCPLEIVSCDFKSAGCEAKLPRRDMPEHLTDTKGMVSHMALLARQNQSLHQQYQEVSAKVFDQKREFSAQLKALSEENGKLRTELTQQNLKLKGHLNIAPLRIYFTDFQRHKQDQVTWHSRYFYSHPRGYKMRLSVDANGSLDGKGSHMSCFVDIVEGEFDEDLPGPFSGRVSVHLQNWLENKNNHIKAINFTGGTDVHMHGYTKFIAHDKLGHDADKKCQYLMHNRLSFWINVSMKP